MFSGSHHSFTNCVLADCCGNRDPLFLQAVRGTGAGKKPNHRVLLPVNEGLPSLGTGTHLKGSGVVPPPQDQVRKKRDDIILHGQRRASWLCVAAMSCVCVCMHVCNIQKHHGKSAAEAETVTGPGRRPVLG